MRMNKREREGKMVGKSRVYDASRQENLRPLPCDKPCHQVSDLESEAMRHGLAGSSIDGARDVDPCLQFPVQPHQHHPQHCRRTDGYKRRDGVHGEGDCVRWTSTVRIHVRRVNRGRVRHCIDEGEASSTLGGRTGHGVADPGESHHVSAVYGWDLLALSLMTSNLLLLFMFKVWGRWWGLPSASWLHIWERASLS